MGLRRSAGRALVWTSLGWVLTIGISFITTIFTARLLSPELFGLVNIVLVIVLATQVFTDAGTRAALVQKDGDIRDEVSTAMVVLPVAGAVATAILAASAGLLASFYDEPRLTPLAVALSGYVFLSSLTIVPDALLQRRMNLRLRKGLVDPLSVTLYGVVVIVLALSGAGVWSLVIGQYMQVTTLLVGSWWLARPRFREGRPTVAAWRGIRRYGRHLVRANLLEIADSQAPIVALGRFVNPGAVGLWGAASRLARMPLSGITHTAATVLFPALARMQSEPERLRSRAVESLRMLSLATVPASVTLIGLGEPLVVILFGEEWRGAGVVLQVLGIWALGLSLTEAGREVFKAVGRTNYIALNALVEAGTFIAFVAALWATGHVSLVAIGVGRALSAAAAMVVAVVNLRHAVSLEPRALWTAVRPAAAGGVLQAAGLLALSGLALSGFETWHEVAGRDLGPLLPLVVLLGLIAVGVGLFAAGAEAAERRSIRNLLQSVRGILRPAASGT